MFRKTALFFTVLSLALVTLKAQDNPTQFPNYSSANSLELQTPDADGIDEVDTLGFYLDEDENVVYQSDLGGSGSMLFSYFKNMPGYGLYKNFDILSVHYSHGANIEADTVVFGHYVHPAKFKITSNYGRRRRRMHYGVDLGYPTGTPVVAAFDGMVRVSKSNAGGYGNLVVIRHDNNMETYYAHLSQRLVNPGQLVHAGDTIGLGGNTGRSYGSHLHFEMRYLGIPINPNKIVDFTNYKLQSDTLYISAKSLNAKNLNVSNTAEVKKTTSSGSGSSSSSSSTSSSDKVYYTVRNGDCLSKIATRYHTSVSRIKQLNGLRSDFLRVGQKLRVR